MSCRAAICERFNCTFQVQATYTTSCAFHAATPLCKSMNPPLRSFSKYPPLWKKAGKANKSHAKSDSSPPVTQAGGPTPTDEVYDMSELEASILKAIEKLTHDLAQLRSGGRLNPDIVESLKVQLGTAGHGKETVRLGDIAQVVPRGRVLNVICGDDAVSRRQRPHPSNVLIDCSTSNPSPRPSPRRLIPSHRLRPSRTTPSPFRCRFRRLQETRGETPSSPRRRLRRRPMPWSSARVRTTTS